MSQELVRAAVEMCAYMTNAILRNNPVDAVKVKRNEWNPGINEYTANRRRPLYLDRKIDGLRQLELKNVEEMSSVHIHRDYDLVDEESPFHQCVPKLARHDRQKKGTLAFRKHKQNMPPAPPPAKRLHNAAHPRA